jgi:hypothetical protein
MTVTFLALCALGLFCLLLMTHVREAKNDVSAIVHDATRDHLIHAQSWLNRAIAIILGVLVLFSIAPIVDEFQAVQVIGPLAKWVTALVSVFSLVIPTVLMFRAWILFHHASSLDADFSDAISYVRKEGFLQLVDQRVLISKSEAISALGDGTFGSIVGISQNFFGALAQSTRSWIWGSMLSHSERIVQQLSLPAERDRSALLNELLEARKLVECTHEQTTFFMVPRRKERLKQTTSTYFEARDDKEILTSFVRWASCQAIIEAIVRSDTPIWDIRSLSIEDRFREKLGEFSIKSSFKPIFPEDLKQLARIDDSIVIVKRASDNAECVVQRSLATPNAGGKFEQRGFLFRRETIWNDKP